MTLTARPRLLIRFAVLAALALCGIVLALSSTGTPPVGAQDGSVPAKPTGVVATATHDSVALAWDDPGDASITHYQIFRRDRDVHDAGEFVTIEDDTGSAAASYTDDTVEPETRYVYRVKAVNAHGASHWSDYRRANTPAAPDPADLAPSGLEVSLVENRVTLSWDAPASDAASVTGYEILRRRPNEGEAALTTLVADTGNAETGYTDDTANEPGVRYTYRVKALRDGEQSQVSNYARIDLPDDYAQDTSGSDEPTPTPEALAPSGLTAEAAEGGGVALSWTAPAEDAGSVTGYEVLRAQGSAELTTLAADTGNTDTTYTDSGVTGDLDDYRYQVKALRGGDASQGSNVAGVIQSAHAGAIVPLADVTLISNLGQTAQGGGNFTNDQAQAFTTGSNSGGYSLTKVVIESRLREDADFTVSVHENDSGAPGTSLGTLTNPTLPVTDARDDYEFTHSGIDLAASTTYFIVVDVGTSSVLYTIYNTNSDAEDTGGATGWSIGDSSLFRSQSSTGSWTTWAQSKRISMTGTVKGGTTNNAPVFADATTTRSVPENSAVGTNVGSAVTATDADSDTLEYTLEGTDAASFTIVSTSGQIKTKTGVTYNHEGTSSYSVTLKADDGNSGTDTIGVTVTVTDVDEPPSAPGAPDVTAASGTTDSLVVDWKEPANTGPAITDYDVQYRKGNSGTFTAWSHTDATTSATITGLEASTSYQVQVKARNDEGASAWSASGTGSTGTPVAALVSNVGQTAAIGDARVTVSQSQGQGFTTGSDSGGYTLGSVELAVSSFSGTASDITVSIYSESSGHPGTVVHTLTTPASISTPVTTFTAPSGTTLAAGTTYYVVISTTGNEISLGRTHATAEDTGGASGWSIADSRRFAQSGSWNIGSVPIRMRVNGAAGATSTNSPATGAPAISGTPVVGELLTADTSNIGDPDGIADADFEYQWIANDGTTDSDISGATGETYRPLLAHVGQIIKVRVTFDDDNDNAESLTSAATAAVTASTYGQVIWSATLTVEEETVAAGTFFGYSIAGRGSLEPNVFTHDGTARGSSAVTGLQYLEGGLLRFDVSGALGGSEDFNLYLDGAPFLIESPGTDTLFAFSDHGLTWTDEQKVEVRLTVNRAATGAPVITGTPEVGETLAADISAIMDEDGVPAADQFAYQWISDDSDIDGATDSTYTLVEADAGKTIKVRVSFTDNAKFPESLTSAAPNSPATAGPTITGFPQLGKTLTADASTIVDPDGTTGATFTYQWVRSDDGTDTDITSATATTYTLVEADVGKLIKVKVSYTDDDNMDEMATSEPVGPVGRRVIDSAGNVDAKGVWFESVAGGGFIIRLSDDEDDHVYGYTTGPFTYSPSHGFDLHADNGDAQGIAAADGVLYVADSGDDKLFAYNVGATGTFGERLTSKEFALHADNQEPAGVWTDGETLYVVDPDEDKVFAYNVGATGTFGASLTDEDVALHADNDDPWGVWSTGTVIWVVDRSDYFIYAYSLSADGARLDAELYRWEWSLDTPDGNTDPWGMWSNDDTLWVLDGFGSKLFAYYLPLPSEPDPPTDAEIDSHGDGELTVEWGAPTDDGGTAITGYTVQWKSGSESFGSARQHTTADGSARSYKITMLTNGTEYTVRVLAVNAKDDSDASNTATGTPSTTPGAPSNVQASGNAELTVTWNAPNNGGSAITGYTVQWKSGTQSYNTSRQATVTTTTHTIPSLTNGTTYTLRVKATNANGDSGWTEITGTPVSGPGVGTVTSGMITQTSAVITVTIANPDTNTQTVNLQYKRNADTNWTSGGTRSTVSAAVTFTLSSLTGNTDYDVRASLDSSFDSGVVTATFKTSPTAPGQTRAVSVNFTADGQVSIIWQEPLDDGGSALTGYKVQWKSGAQSFGGDPLREGITGVTPPRSYVITGLTNGTEYTVRVIAVNAVGDGPPSDEATGTPARQPDVPSNVQASGNAELTVTWDAPNDGGSAITGYTVQWKSGIEGYSTSRQAIVTTTSHTIPTLNNGTTYTVRVKATNAFGDSDWTEITGTPVSGPGVASVTVDQASITQTLADVTVTVANLQNASHQVYLRYRVEGGSWPSAANQSTATSGTAVTFTLTGLTGNTEYDVAASLDSGFASGVKTATFTTSPTKPGKTRSVVTASGNSEVAIAWTPPLSDGGSAITGYKVQWKSGSQSFGDPSREHTTTGASVTAYLITGLTNGTEYTVRVIAVNAVGDGPPSNTTTGTPEGPPDAPPNVQAGSGHQQLTVSWGAPNDGGSAITEYRLQWKSGGQGFSSSRQRTIAAPSRTDTIPSLTNGTEYTVRVRATTALGNSGWFAEAKGTPREGPHVSLVKVKEPISCDVTFVALEFVNLEPATEYHAHLRFRVQGNSSWTVLSPQGFWSSGIRSGAARGELNGPSPAFTLPFLAYETTYDVQAALDSGFVEGLATTTFSTPNLSEVYLMPLSPGDGTLGLRMSEPDSGGEVVGYLVQWKSGDEEYDETDTSERQADVPGSGDREYTITGLDNDVEYTVRAMAYNDNGIGVPSIDVKGTPEAPPNSPARGAPTISGTAQVGETLTADTDGIEDDDGLDDAVYSYQWLADGADISGATGETYTPAYDDQGKVISVKVSFIDARDFEETLTSEPTEEVAADPDAPTESPNAPRTVRIVGDTNTSLTLTWDAPDGGTSVTEYRVQWLTLGENFATARRDGREAVLGASARSHTITGLSEYGFYQVRVLAVNGAGESEGSNTAWGITGLGEGQYGHG